MRPSSRIYLTIAVVLSAVVVYRVWTSISNARARNSTPGAVLAPETQSWYFRNQPFWTSLDFVSLKEKRQLVETIGKLVDAQIGRAKFEEGSLVRDISGFLWAWSSSDQSEYLDRIGGSRRIRTDPPTADRVLHYFAGEFLDEYVGSDTTPVHLFRSLWGKSLERVENRIGFVSRTGIVEVVDSKRLPPHDNSRINLIAQVLPKLATSDAEDSDRWIGPFDQGYPRLTEPREPLRQVLEEYQRAKLCYVHVAVRGEEGQPYPLTMMLYYSPRGRNWHVEWLTNRHPDELCRPF